MGDLEVCVEGLAALARQCSETASQLMIDCPAPNGYAPAQATATTVSQTYGALNSLNLTLARRVETTGDLLIACAEEYSRTEKASAELLRRASGRWPK